MFQLPQRIQFIGSFCAGALAAGTLVAFAMSGASGPAAATRAIASPVRPPQAAPARLDRLRNEAASGDAFSTHALASILLDRYDQTGSADDLYEAVVWIERRWDGLDNADLVGRVVERYCGQRVVRWHWLCVSGE